MKSEDIHNGLDKENLRNYLSKLERTEAFQGRAGEIPYLEKELERIKERLIHCKNHEAIITMIKINGWELFDVEDFVPYNKDTYFLFLGTNKEFESLKKSAKLQNEE